MVQVSGIVFVIPFVIVYVYVIVFVFLSDPGVPGVRSMGPDVTHSVQDYVET